MAGFLIGATAVSLALITIYRLLVWLQLWQRRAKIIRDNKCEPARHVRHLDPIFGSDFFLEFIKAYNGSRLLEKLDSDLQKYGKTFQATQFSKELIYTKDPVLFKHVTSTDFKAWGVQDSRYKATALAFGESFFSLDGERWKHGRALAMPVLSKNEYGDLERLERHVERFIALLPSDGSSVQMNAYFNRLFQSVGTEYFLGEVADTLSENKNFANQEVIKSIGTVLYGVQKRMFMGPLLNILPVEKEFVEACNNFHAFLDRNVEKAFERNRQRGIASKSTPSDGKQHRIFLDEMLTQTTDRKELRDAGITMYGAGTETTSKSMTALMWVLSRHPEVVQKLRDEISAACSGLPNLATLQKMKYLRAVIWESMRLYGVSSAFNMRTATEDTILPAGGGKDGKCPVFVKKGTELWMALYSLHRDPEIWGQDTLVFRPERFLEKPPGFWEFQPFSSGPRVCPGQNLALTNISYILVRILQNYQAIEARDTRPWTEHLAVGLENKYGALVGLIPA